MEQFYENVIPRSGLPNDFGGELKSVAEMHEQFKNEFYNLREYFRSEEEQRGYNWDKLIKTKGKQKDNEQIIQNFQKLDID